MSTAAESWTVVTWHSDCAECEDLAESAIDLAKVRGSVSQRCSSDAPGRGVQHSAEVTRA